MYVGNVTRRGSKLQMNDDELRAYRFLLSSGYTENDIEYEPNGPGTFPDFLLKSAIGVEVTRISPRIDLADDLSYENIFWPIAHGLEEFVRRESKRFQRRSAWIEVTIHSTAALKLQKCRTRAKLSGIVRNFIREKLQEYIDDDQMQEIQTRELHGSNGELIFDIVFRRRNRFANPGIKLGAIDIAVDDGWALPTIERGIHKAIAMKDSKLSLNKISFNEYWLILLDHVAYGRIGNLPVFVKQEKSRWSRYFLLNPIDPENGKDISHLINFRRWPSRPWPRETPPCRFET